MYLKLFKYSTIKLSTPLIRVDWRQYLLIKSTHSANIDRLIKNSAGVRYWACHGDEGCPSVTPWWVTGCECRTTPYINPIRLPWKAASNWDFSKSLEATSTRVTRSGMTSLSLQSTASMISSPVALTTPHSLPHAHSTDRLLSRYRRPRTTSHIAHRPYVLRRVLSVAASCRRERSARRSNLPLLPSHTRALAPFMSGGDRTTTWQRLTVLTAWTLTKAWALNHFN